MANGGSNSGMGNIEWDVEKLRAYFDDCQSTYDSFLAMSDALMRAFQAFVNDDDHTGEEADSAKGFVSQKQIPLLIDIVDDIQQLEELQEKLMESFATEVDSAEDAIIKTEFLDKITLDYGKCEDTLKDTGDKVIAIANNLNSVCSEVGSYTVPSYTELYGALEKMASNDTTKGIAPETKKSLEDFDSTHSTDISVSTYQTLYDTIMYNIQSFINGVGDGRYYDITTYTGKKGDLDWKTPLDYLDGTALTEYKQFVEDMHAYLKGKKERCEVYKYDPVNMCTGNYINEHEDFVIGGKHQLEFKRFYNAISNELKDLGWGWTHSYEVRIYDIQSDSKIKIAYADGSEGSFRKEQNYYIEEHGEPGILEKLENDMGYIIKQDDGSYEKFDWDGRLSSIGDEDGDHTVIHYEIIEDRSRRIKKVLTKNGSSLEFSYYEDGDSKGLVEKVTDHTGRSVCYTYDDTKHLVQIIDVDGAVRRFTYTEDGKIKDVINANGITAITNEYDKQNRTIKQSFPDNSVMTYEYDDINKTTTAVEQNGNRVVYTHDELERHTKTTYFDGEERFTYNVRSQKTSFTDKRGNTTRFAYDNRGHLTKVIDALGNKTFYTYRPDGKPLNVKGPRGDEYKYNYDLAGKLFELKNPLGETQRFYYKEGNLYKTRNANGGVILFDYDEKGNVNTITDPDGVVTEYSYDALNRVVETKTADGAVTRYEYDAADRIIKTTDALGYTREYTYDKLGNVIAEKGPDGAVKAYDHNVMGRVSKVIDEAGNVTEITYNVMGKQEEVHLPNGGVVKYEYDPLMRIIGITDPEGRTSRFEYDANGNLTAEYLSDVKIRAVEYDELNRVSKDIDALGHVTSYEYDEAGNVTSITDTLGHKNTIEYDLLGRVVRECDALSNETVYTYTKLGLVETIKDASGRIRSFEYTDAGKLKAIRFCGKLEQEITYDNVGRIAKRNFADGYEISYTYDALSRVIKVEGSDDRTVAYEYDAMGRATKVVDGDNTTLYTYTATGRIKSVVDALGNETTYTYDSLHNIKSIQRAEGLIADRDKELPVIGEDGHVTLYDYDLSGLLTTITDALGQKEHYSYDQYGRLQTKTDRDNYSTSYTYNNLGGLTKVGYADGRSVSFAYDELNQLNEINDWLGKTVVENDALGRVTKVTDYQNRSVSYEYGKVGEKTRLIYPDGKEVLYNYNERGQLLSIVGNGNETNYSYDELGRLINKSFGNGVSQAYSYLPGGNLESMTSSDKEGQLDKYFYHYNNSGLIDGIERSRRGLEAVSGQYEYSYDQLGRLTQSSLNGKLQAAYEYDAYGNRTGLTENESKTTYSYDVLDRLVQAKELNNSQAVVKTYDYDKRGNQTKEYVDGLLQKTFTFDVTNMLSKVVDVNKGEVENQYNGLGYRVSSTRPEEKIEYLCDLSRDCYNLLERTVNGETESFIYDSNVVSMSKAGNNFYYLQDELGSPMYMTGTDGVAVTSYAFDDFGRNLDPRTGKRRKHEYTTQGNIIQPFAFTGYQEDEVSGLKFAQARFYSAENGRFVGEDQVRGFTDNPDTQNHYLYCFNNSIMYVDLNGLFAVLAAMAATVAVGGAIGAITGAAANLVTQGVKIATGKQEKFDVGSLAGSVAEGAIVGAATSFCATGIGGLACAVIGGGLGAAANSAISQKINTGKVNGSKVLEEGIVGAVSGGLFYGVGKTVKAVKNAMPGVTPEKAGQSLFSKFKDSFKELDKCSKYYDQVIKSGHRPGKITRVNLANAKDAVKQVVKDQFKKKLWYSNAGDVAKKVFKYSKTAFYATCPLLNFKSQIKSGLKALCPVYRDNKGDTFVNFARKYHDDLNGAFQCLVEG